MKSSTIVFLILSIIIVLLIMTGYVWLLNLWQPDLLFNNSAWGTTGTFGDSFGALTSLFSALAFAGIIYSLYEQDQHVRIDRFDSKFFQLLQAQRELVAEMDLKRKIKFKDSDSGQSRITTHGRECFKVIYNQHFVNMIFKYRKDHEHAEGPLEESKIKGRDTLHVLPLKVLIQVYDGNLFPKFQNDLGHYYRHLFRIVEMLDEANFIKDKKHYIGILRAQMSTYELLLLFYNGLSPRGKEFRKLIEKYALLKSMNAGYLMNGTEDSFDSENGYEQSAFGRKPYDAKKAKQKEKNDIRAQKRLAKVFDALKDDVRR